jgi:simple sugar transport system permease protein
MIISGLLAGLASFVNLTTITPNLNFAIDNLPTIGYDSIAISLVAFNNPVGIFFTSFLWGTLNSSGTSTASLFGIPSQLSALIFGIIVYFSAISVVFIQYYPILKLRISLAVLESRKNRIEIARLQRLQNQYRFKLVKIKNEKEVVDYKQQIEIAKNQALATYEKSQKTRQDLQEFNAKLAQLKKDYHEYISEYRKTLIEVIKKLKYDINNLKTETYIGKINHAKSGINRRHFRYVRNLEINAVEKHSNLHTTKLLAKDQLKLERDNRIYYKRNETKKAKQVRKSSLRSNYY